MSRAGAIAQTGAAIGGMLIVFVVGLGIASVALPPIIDRLVPLEGAAAVSPGALPGTDSGTTPTPSPSTGILMNGVPVGNDADCAACHKPVNGTMGVAVTPVLGHPLQGFTHCSSCHSDSRLVPTAPGHQSFTEDQCLACHREPGGNAPARPHHVYPGKQCTDCHNGKIAPLPASMGGRTTCWLCHHDTPGASAFPSLPAGTSPLPSLPGASASP